MTGLAIWHFMVFVPDRFWQGIVGVKKNTKPPKRRWNLRRKSTSIPAVM